METTKERSKKKTNVYIADIKTFDRDLRKTIKKSFLQRNRNKQITQTIFSLQNNYKLRQNRQYGIPINSGRKFGTKITTYQRNQEKDE